MSSLSKFIEVEQFLSMSNLFHSEYRKQNLCSFLLHSWLWGDINEWAELSKSQIVSLDEEMFYQILLWHILNI